MFYSKCTSGEYNVETQEQYYCGHAHCRGVGRGSWYVQCNISHTIDSLESPTPFDTAKQATLQCVKRKRLIGSLSLCHYSMVLSKKHCVTW